MSTIKTTKSEASEHTLVLSNDDLKVLWHLLGATPARAAADAGVDTWNLFNLVDDYCEDELNWDFDWEIHNALQGV